MLRQPAPGWALLLLLLGCYLLTMSGHTYTPDEETMLAAAESLLAGGSFAVERDFLMDVVPGADGQHYSKYGPGQSLAAVPFLLVGQAVAAGMPAHAAGLVVRLFVLLLPALVTAATALLLYAWVRRLGYGVRVALAVGVLYGLTSMAWPYSRTFFAEPLATLLLLVCAYALHHEDRRWWAAAGAAAACALAVKVQAALALPCIAGYAVLLSWSSATVSRLRWRMLVGRAGWGGLGALLPLGLLLLYNTHLFGAPLSTGYGGSNIGWLFDGWWQQGLYGLILSPGKGIFIFSPTLLLGVVGMVVGWRWLWRETLLALALLVVHLAFYSSLSYWHGDGSWGPRYLLFVLPFLYLPAAGTVVALAALPHRTARARIARGATGVLVLLSVLVQLLPVVVNLNTYIQVSDPTARYFSPPGSPIRGHARLWGQRIHEWWLRVAPPPGVVVLRDGFSYSEGDRSRGVLLPRWSHAEARIMIYPLEGADAPLHGRLVVGDHRPWTPEHPLPRATFGLLLNGEPLEGVQRTDLTGEQIMWELRFQLAPEQVQPAAELTLQSDTWNPTQVTQDNPRNEDLGLFVETVAFTQAGQPLTLYEALPIPAPDTNRRNLWLWYYDTPNHHLLDVWWWYLLVAALPAWAVAVLLAVIGVPALLALLVGGRGVLLAVADTR
jgi:4-amino-4-deoxy-L-arabinose transferase-like glycosyltransferase